ncbi:transposase [Streptomyces scopuliridis]|uniref:transposase n=1 Tax=Streptomyces scopuliridis TaxID=452529 RepID=UPI00369625D2
MAADRRCRPLAFTLTPGQAADSPQFVPVLAKVRVRGRPGRPRTRPDAVAGDKAYSSRANRAHLRERGIKAVIPEKKDQAANRKKKGTAGQTAGHSRCGPVQGPQHRRTPDQQAQSVARDRRPVRQDAGQLPRRPPPPRHRHLASQSPTDTLIATPHRP